MQGSENRSQTPPQGGVVIPPQTVAQSNATKAARKKTMAQLPVYRAACNLLYVIVIITKRCPKSIRKFTDQIIYDCTELIKAIGMADTSREIEMRVHYINTALVLINSMGAEFWRYFFVRGHYETIRIRPSYRPVNINL